jgi:CRP-like cAMP-binding protein
MHKVKHSPLQNHILAALPSQEFKRLEANLELVRLTLGQELYEADPKSSCAYFPTISIVSLLNVLEDGRCAEIAVVGNEGLLGISLFLGGDTTLGRAVVQSAGWCYRLGSRFIMEEFTRGGPVMLLLLRYSQALITQMAQTAMCNLHHSIDQQLCRLLLLSPDRIDSDSLKMTQELIANMLGVRREGATNAAGKLQREGYIRYSRGRITLLNRPGLDQRVCEHYSVVKQKFDHLLAVIEPQDPQHVLGMSMPNPVCQALCQLLSDPSAGDPLRAWERSMPTPLCQSTCLLI